MAEGGLAEPGSSSLSTLALPEIDSWYQRAEVSPLNKMKSMSQVGGGDRKIYQGPGKINIWMGTRQEQLPEGGLFAFI